MISHLLVAESSAITCRLDPNAGNSEIVLKGVDVNLRRWSDAKSNIDLASLFRLAEVNPTTRRKVR